MWDESEEEEVLVYKRYQGTYQEWCSHDTLTCCQTEIS